MYLTMSFIANFFGLLLLYIPLHICTIHRLSVPTISIASYLHYITELLRLEHYICTCLASRSRTCRVWKSRKLYMSSLDYLCTISVLLLHQLI